MILERISYCFVKPITVVSFIMSFSSNIFMMFHFVIMCVSPCSFHSVHLIMLFISPCTFHHAVYFIMFISCCSYQGIPGKKGDPGKGPKGEPGDVGKPGSDGQPVGEVWPASCMLTPQTSASVYNSGISLISVCRIKQSPQTSASVYNAGIPLFLKQSPQIKAIAQTKFWQQHTS